MDRQLDRILVDGWVDVGNEQVSERTNGWVDASLDWWLMLWRVR